MADKKISALTAASTPLAGTEVLPIVQSGATVKVTVDNLTKGKIVNALTFDTDVAAAGVTLTGTTLAADGTDANININVTPKGTGNLITTNFANSGVANLGNSQAALASGGYTHRVSGKSVSDGATFYSSYGAMVWNADGTFTSGARRFLLTNAYELNKFAIIRSVDATTDPTIGVNGAVSSGTVDFSVTNVGDVVVNTGNLVIGTSGKGIDFSADPSAAGMTSELLDDYEEGTFTPIISGSTTAGAGTYSVQAGSYTKIGNRLLFSVYFAWSAHTGTGNMRISGLPTAATNDNANYGAVSVFMDDAMALTAGNLLQVRTVPGAASLFPLQVPTGGGAPAQIPLPTSGAIMLTGHYYI